MKSIEELQADLKLLYAELEERRIMEQETVPKTVDFAQLSSKAERMKIEKHPMQGKDEHEQGMYLLLLLSVIAMDDTVYETSFSLLYRIVHGMEFKGDVQELFLQANQLKFERLDEVTRLFIEDDVRLVMLMECMMLVQSFKKEYKKGMEYVAELCILMKLEKDQIVMISNIARVVLMQNVTEYKCTIKNTYEVFNCYLYPLEKSKNLDIIIVRKDCNQYTSSYNSRITTYQGKVFTGDSKVLRMKYSGKNGEFFQYTYPSRIYYVCGYGYETSTTNSGERTIDLFSPKSGHECVYFREEISNGDFKDVLIAVTTNSPDLAYSLAIQRFNEVSEEKEGE